MQTLPELRAQVDAIDEALCKLLARRFELTDAIGQWKAQHQQAASDPLREQQQATRYHELSTQLGIDPQFTQQLFRQIIDQVVENHKRIANG